MSGIERIAAERKRQMSVKGWTPEHDDGHNNFELLEAAICYANEYYHAHLDSVPSSWPWEPEAWKPSTDIIRNLEKAGALIAAEIDRLDRTNG